jgi:uncharacterized membrane protein
MRKRDLVTGMAVGAGMVYYLDPREGAARRLRLADRLRDLLSELADEGRTRGLGRWREGREAWPPPQPGHYGARVGDIGGLEAANLGHAGVGHGLTSGAGLLGLLLTIYGLTRRGLVGLGFRTLGAGLVVSELREGHSAPLPAGERRRTVDIQKTLRIEAPVDRVYAFWSDCTNFPLFLSNVRRVDDLGAGRSRWTILGPAGEAVEWDTSVTVESPGELLAWRSEPGALLEHAGAVRFSSEGSGTRIDLRFCYNPPPPGAGRGMAEVLGGDPRARLNQDLGRLKALLESDVRSEAHGEESGT